MSKFPSFVPTRANPFALPLGFFLTLGVMAYSQESQALFDFLKLWMFSEVNGQVVDQGKPIAGARVERSYKWTSMDEPEVTESTLTDAEGKFHFPAVYKTSLRARFTPHAPLIYQKIMIYYEGKEYLAWKRRKDNYNFNGDAEGWDDNDERFHYLMNILCDINKPSSELRTLGPFGYFGLCDFIGPKLPGWPGL